MNSYHMSYKQSEAFVNMVTFSEKFKQNKRLFIELLLNKVGRVVSSDKWHIEKLQKFINFKQMWAQLVQIKYSMIPDLKEISRPAFNNLAELSLSGCNICQIQALTFMIMPKLSKLQLRNNKISQLRCLNKTSFPHLDELFIKKNKFQQVPDISRMRLAKQGLYLDWVEKCTISQKPMDVRFYIKIQTSSFFEGELKKTEKFKRVSLTNKARNNNVVFDDIFYI